MRMTLAAIYVFYMAYVDDLRWKMHTTQDIFVVIINYVARVLGNDNKNKP